MRTLLRTVLRRRLLDGLGLLALVAAVSGFVIRPSGHPNPGLTLASSACTTSGTFCVSSPSPGPTLYPGAGASSMPLTLTNYSNVPLHVYQITVAFTNSFPAQCDVTAFQLDGTAFSSTSPSVTVSLSSPNWITIPAATGSGPSTATFPATLALADNHKDQSSCEGTKLGMSYSALAYYTVPTTTKLASSTNPSTWGQNVTLTATVASAITPTSAGTTPVGTVTFYECIDSACGTTAVLGSAPVTTSTGQAAITTSFEPTGSYQLYAAYTPGCKSSNPTCSTSQPDFGASRSGQLTQTVNYSSCITAKHSGALTVPSGQDICITSAGSQDGRVEVQGGARLDLLGGSINGGITVDSGGSLSIQGGSVNGAISATGSSLLDICSASENGSLSISSASGLVIMGGPGCAGNSISGSVSLSNNGAGIQIAGNSISGGLTATGNTGGSNTISANKIGGALACSGNVPAPTDKGSSNTVGGKRSGQCATPASF